nr:hypothetical protein GCM10017547_34700 [Pseudarthrobacter oxydans]BFE45580.1 hypothetical protein GCM10017547_34730 [Pseudarthrobacter oxydans]
MPPTPTGANQFLQNWWHRIPTHPINDALLGIFAVQGLQGAQGPAGSMSVAEELRVRGTAFCAGGLHSPKVRSSRAAAGCRSAEVRGRLKSHRRIDYLKIEHYGSQTISRRWLAEMALTCGNERNRTILDPYKIADFLTSES